MSFRYQPKNVLKRVSAKKNVQKLITKKLTPNKIVLNALDRSGVVGGKRIEKTALKVLKNYKKRIQALRNEGYTKAEAIAEITKEPKLLVQRIQNETAIELSKQIQEQYHGEFYVWLPSTAANPDEDHMLNYGKTFQFGKGEAPGDRYGCRCGMEVLTSDKKLILE